MPNTLIKIQQGVARHPDYRLAAPLSFELYEGESVAICGPNGGGKSFFVDMLTGAHPLLGDAIKYNFRTFDNSVVNNVKTVKFRDVYGGYEPAYYQQRWNRADEQVFPTVGELLKQAQHAWKTDNEEPASLTNNILLNTLGINEHINKPVNILSSGELRRFQLAKMLVSCPQVLIVDNPYIGLDKEARTMLTQVFEKLSKCLTLVLVVSRSEDISKFIERIVWVEDKRVKHTMEAAEFWKKRQASLLPFETSVENIPIENRHNIEEKNSVIDFRNIHIQYGSHTILDQLNWEVKRGEHWALTGENGAGKSTLLSLVCADNPQAYACDIRLFGQKRGMGESIWEIKKHIGFVSPELFSTYHRPLSSIDIVASGMHDTIGLYKRITPAERTICREWMKAFGADHLQERNYMHLSTGEQRLVLLIRAFVKNPDLLILDEPFHGLDNHNLLRAQSLIDLYMQDPSKTLIMVTHYEEELPKCIDHVLRLRKNV